ncbi:MAG: hypothetical protein WCT32_04215 [Patescibacteria group bacterium]|jgi:hypothetical protein
MTDILCPEMTLEDAWTTLGPGLAEMVRRAEDSIDGSNGMLTLRHIWNSNERLRPSLRRVYSSLGIGAATLTVIDFLSESN